MDVDVSMLDSLRQRRTFQVATAYGLVAWLTVQFADIVLEGLDAPNWVMQGVLLLLLAGLPITLLVSWLLGKSEVATPLSGAKGAAVAGSLVMVTVSVLIQWR